MRQGVVGATAIMMTTFVASRFLGWLRLSVIGAYFGLSKELDAYWAANVIPESLFNLIVAGAITAAFIPVFTSYLAKEREGEGWRVASTVINSMLLLLVTASAVLAIAAPLFMPYLARFRDRVIRPFIDSYRAGETPIPCAACNGYRLKPEALAVKIAGHHIGQVTEKSIRDRASRP